MRFDDQQAGDGSSNARSSDSKAMQPASGDDRPVAVNDANLLTAGEAQSVTGNVLANDQPGRDGGAVRALSSNNTGARDERADGSGNLRVNGEFGNLTVNADRTHRYNSNANPQATVTHLFTYRLADRDGDDASATLAIRILDGRVDVAANAVRIVPGPEGIVLPPGVGLDDIRVVGSDLVITLPDGTQWVIVDGAIFVPQFVVNGAVVPPTTLASLLIGQDPVTPGLGLEGTPATPQSSGGNFAVPLGDIGDPFALGDLLPPTDLVFSLPTNEEPLQDI